MTWRVEVLNATVVGEIEALPKDIQAAFLRLSERIEIVGLERNGSLMLNIYAANYGKCG